MSTTNTTELQDFCSMSKSFVSWVWSTIAPITLFGGLLSNMVIILVFRYPNFLQSSTVLYFFVLAISDSVSLVIGMGFQWLFFAFDFSLQDMSNFICKFSNFVSHTSLDFSSWVLVSITLERVCRVRMPLETLGLFTVKRAKMGILMIFVFFSGINMHFFFTYGLMRKADKTKVCHVLTDTYTFFIEYIFVWMDLCFVSLFPFIIMAISNGLIINSMRSSIYARSTDMKNSSHDIRSTSVDDFEERTFQTAMFDDETRSQRRTINILAEPRQSKLDVGQRPDSSKQNLDNPNLILDNPRLSICNPGVINFQTVSTTDQSSSVMFVTQKVTTDINSAVNFDNQITQDKISDSESSPVVWNIKDSKGLQSTLSVPQNTNTRHHSTKGSAKMVNVRNLSLRDHCSPKDIINNTCQSEVTFPNHGMETVGVMIDTHHNEINPLTLDEQSHDRTSNINRNEVNSLNPDMKLVNVSSNICLAEITFLNPITDSVNVMNHDNTIEVNCVNPDPKSEKPGNVNRKEVNSPHFTMAASQDVINTSYPYESVDAMAASQDVINTSYPYKPVDAMAASQDIINTSYPYKPVDAMANKRRRSDGHIRSPQYWRWAATAITTTKRFSRPSPIIGIVSLATLVFLVTTMPYAIYMVVNAFLYNHSDNCTRNNSVLQMVRATLTILRYVNSGVNLYVYLARSKPFRNQVIFVLTWNYCRRRSPRLSRISQVNHRMSTFTTQDF